MADTLAPHHDAVTAAAPDIAADTAALVELGQAARRAGYRFTSVSQDIHARVNARAPEWAADLTDILGWNRPFRSDSVAVPAGILQLMHQACILRPWRDGWRSTLRLATLGRHSYFHSAYNAAGAEPGDVRFGPDTYRFMRAFDRDAALLRQAPARIADIGCGAGAAAISMATRWPRAAVTALDSDAAARRLARANALLAGTRNVDVVDAASTQAAPLGGVDGQFDLIVAQAASAGHAVELVRTALARLAPGGALMLHVDVTMPMPMPARGGRGPFFDAVTALMAGTGWKWNYAELDPEVFGDAQSGAADEAHLSGRNAAIWLTAFKPARYEPKYAPNAS